MCCLLIVLKAISCWSMRWSIMVSACCSWSAGVKRGHKIFKNFIVPGPGHGGITVIDGRFGVKVQCPPNWGIPSNRSARRLTGRFFKTSRPGRYSLGSYAGGRHEFFHICTSAFGTLWRRVTGRQQERFKAVTTGFTLIFVNRHWFLRKKFL